PNTHRQLTIVNFDGDFREQSVGEIGRGAGIPWPSQPVSRTERMMTYEPPGPGPYWTHPGYGPEIDAGLRQYMVRVYGYMAAGLGISGIVAYLAVATGLYQQIVGTPLIWIVLLSPLGMVLLLSFGVDRISIGAAFFAFWIFAALMGLSLAGIFLVFTGASIARVFFISAATFAAMSLYGYTTGRDLSRFGAFLFMGLIGIIITGLVNIFCRLERAAICDFADRRYRVNWAQRLRHATHQASISSG
ncbi:MAG TPA: Bax inhibitor-1/YccA family protein, partial [Candidatus Binataceae bacterium]|nr:Bax inhibitor-1/YccA family protein [Candidatus Binataceae bacterium]